MRNCLIPLWFPQYQHEGGERVVVCGGLKGGYNIWWENSLNSLFGPKTT